MRGKKVVLNPVEIERCAALGYNTAQIARRFSCAKRLFEGDGKYAASYKKGHFSLRDEIFSKQIELAKKGNVTMLIWLGKVMFEQSETQKVELKNETPIDVKENEEAIRDAFAIKPGAKLITE